MLELRHLHFHYPNHPEREIISDVSLTLHPGEMIALVGPNGSGKSTLLELAGGSCHPQKGEVLCDGLPVAKMTRREIARRLACVTHGREIRFPLTALEYVLTGRYAHVRSIGFDDRDDLAIARQALLDTDAWQFAGRPIGELSMGERQRVALARALAQQPQFLLLDEPTANADLVHQISILRLIRELAARSIGSIIVTHDLNLAAEFTDRVLLLKAGRLLAAGRPEEVMTVEILRELFDVPLLIDRHPRSGNPRISWEGSFKERE